MPSEREMKESKAAQECLIDMINEAKKLFIMPSGSNFELEPDSNRYEPDAPFLSQLGVSDGGNYKTYLLQKSKELLKVYEFFL